MADDSGDLRWLDQRRYLVLLPLWWTPDGILRSDWDGEKGQFPSVEDGFLVPRLPDA